MKRKQIIVLGLVLVIISVGILQYNYRRAGESSASDDYDLLLENSDIEEIPGAAVYVENGGIDNTEDIPALSGQHSGFFAEAKMERDKARSRQKEELKVIAQGSQDAVAASSMTSSEAQEQIVEVIRRSEAETTIETLIKQRGFEDALAYMSDTGHIDVIVKASSLSSREVAQISDIVVRHADVTMDKITVKNVE